MFLICIFILCALLFFILTPGILLTIPPKSSKKTVVIVHSLVFALVITIIWHFTYKLNYNTNESFVYKEPFVAPVPISAVQAKPNTAADFTLSQQKTAVKDSKVAKFIKSIKAKI